MAPLTLDRTVDSKRMVNPGMKIIMSRDDEIMFLLFG
jgi:hypothetical protein